MTISFTYNGVALDPDRVRLRGDPNNAEASWTSSANSGGYDTASVVIDDPDDNLDTDDAEFIARQEAAPDPPEMHF